MPSWTAFSPVTLFFLCLTPYCPFLSSFFSSISFFSTSFYDLPTGSTMAPSQTVQGSMCYPSNHINTSTSSLRPHAVLFCLLSVQLSRSFPPLSPSPLPSSLLPLATPSQIAVLFLFSSLL